LALIKRITLEPRYTAAPGPTVACRAPGGLMCRMLLIPLSLETGLTLLGIRSGIFGAMHGDGDEHT
jgi:hypothetical protein